MTITEQQFESAIGKTLKTNQWIVFFAMMVSLSLFIWNENYVYWSLLLLAISSICLIAINQCKSDRKHFRSGLLRTATGTLVDSFPQNEKAQAWVIFVQEDISGKVLELTSPINPSLKLNEKYNVMYTPKMNILVKISE